MSKVSALSIKQLQEENAKLLALIAQKNNTIENLQHQLHLFTHVTHTEELGGHIFKLLPGNLVGSNN